MAILGIILLGIVIFVVLGVLGWIIKGIGWSFELLGEGVRSCFGCLIWIFFLFVLLMIL